MSSCRILFLLKQRITKLGDEPHKRPGLWNAIDSLAKKLTHVGIPSETLDVCDMNAINAAVHKYRPKVVIIEAYWVTPAKLRYLSVIHSEIHWIVRNHSEVPFLAEEGMGGTWTCEYLKLGAEVGSVSSRTVEDMYPLVRNLGAKPEHLSWLPNVYPIDHVVRPHVKYLSDDEIHIGCFGSIRPLKNHFEQSMAAIRFASETNRKLFFHINAGRVEGNGGQNLKNLQGVFRRLFNCELIEHGWLSKDDFYKLMRDKIDLVMQCSLTESFNVVSADAVLSGVPVLASPEIRWLGSYSHANPTYAKSMSDAMKKLFSGSREDVQAYSDRQFADLKSHNEIALAEWIRKFG